jgi:multidrug efflux pump
MVFGVLPLVIASGAGAAGRKAMGIVIFSGLSIGTLFTLFVVPAMYLFIAARHQKTESTENPPEQPALPGAVAPEA